MLQGIKGFTEELERKLCRKLRVEELDQVNKREASFRRAITVKPKRIPPFSQFNSILENEVEEDAKILDSLKEKTKKLVLRKG